MVVIKRFFIAQVKFLLMFLFSLKKGRKSDFSFIEMEMLSVFALGFDLG